MVSGMSRSGSSLSALDLVQAGSLLSLQGPVCCGLLTSIYGTTWLGAPPPTLDLFMPGPPPFARSPVRPGSLLPAYGMSRSDELLATLDCLHTGLSLLLHGPS